MSPYKYCPVWVSVGDRDAGNYLRLFTLLPRKDIEALDDTIASAPEKREAQQTLARDVTARVHSEEAAGVAEEVSRVLFGRADPTTLSESVLEALSEEDRKSVV